MSKYTRLLLLAVIICAVASFGFSGQCGSQSSQPENDISREELQQGSQYWNEWSDITELKNKAKDLALVSINRHHYIENEYDCNDMATDLWNMLSKGGTTGGPAWDPITSIIVVGDLDIGEETFAECDHAWIAILNKPPEEGAQVTIYALEPTNGEIYISTGKSGDPNAKYFEGFFYEKPSDLRTDLGDRW